MGNNDLFVGSCGYIDGVQGVLYPEELAVWCFGVFIAKRWGCRAIIADGAGGVGEVGGGLSNR